MPSNTLKPKITVGCDPEIFLADKSGKIVSAHNLIPGTKEKPFKVDYGAVQVDGVAAEINTIPTENYSQFEAYVQRVLGSLKTMVPMHELKYQPVAVFDPEYFESLPENVKLLGCDPDFNAWTGQVNPPPNSTNKYMRSGAGHIHLGWTSVDNPMDESHFGDCRVVAKQLDYTLGVYTLLWDNDSRRRELYGKAGAFRPKPYGIEYRTPSNMWLRFPQLYSQIFYIAAQTIGDLISGDGIVLEDKFGDKARQIIDTNDYEFVRGGDLKKTIHRYQKFDWPKW